MTAPLTTLIACPVLDCDWTLDTTPPTTPEGALAEVFGWGVVAATHRAQALRDNELKAQAHLKGHTVIEWMNTVTALKEQLAAQIMQTIEMANAFGSRPS